MGEEEERGDEQQTRPSSQKVPAPTPRPLTKKLLFIGGQSNPPLPDAPAQYDGHDLLQGLQHHP